MAETIISPGVLARENDQSFQIAQPIQAGAAIIGPTVRGKIGIPTICTSYSDYTNKFGAHCQLQPISPLFLSLSDSHLKF